MLKRTVFGLWCLGFGVWCIPHQALGQDMSGDFVIENPFLNVYEGNGPGRMKFYLNGPHSDFFSMSITGISNRYRLHDISVRFECDHGQGRLKLFLGSERRGVGNTSFIETKGVRSNLIEMYVQRNVESGRPGRVLAFTPRRGFDFYVSDLHEPARQKDRSVESLAQECSNSYLYVSYRLIDTNLWTEASALVEEKNREVIDLQKRLKSLPDTLRIVVRDTTKVTVRTPDLNGDGKVNFLDFLLFAQAFRGD